MSKAHFPSLFSPFLFFFVLIFVQMLINVLVSLFINVTLSFIVVQMLIIFYRIHLGLSELPYPQFPVLHQPRLHLKMPC